MQMNFSVSKVETGFLLTSERGSQWAFTSADELGKHIFNSLRKPRSVRRTKKQIEEARKGMLETLVRKEDLV